MEPNFFPRDTTYRQSITTEVYIDKFSHYA